MPLDVPDDKGATRRTHLESVARQTGKRPVELTGPDFPEQLGYLWSWFQSANRGRRTGNGFGPSRITWGDLKAWSDLTATALLPWESDVILSLDNIWLNARQDKK